MFPKDALDLLQTTAKNAESQVNTMIKPPAGTEPDHVYYTKMIGPNGFTQLVRVEGKRKPHHHKAYDFETLAKRNVSEEGNVSFWYSANNTGDGNYPNATAIFDNDYRDEIVLRMGISDQLSEIIEWSDSGYDGHLLDHKQIFRLFRTLFRENLKAHEGILKINYTAAAQSESEQKRSGQSISKSMMKEASNVDKLPEVLRFNIPYFEEALCAACVFEVQVAFDIIAEDEKFRMIVLPGEIDAAVFEADEFLRKKIEAAVGEAYKDTEINPPVYRGRPS